MLGKIVNNFECYIVVFLNSEEAHNSTVRTNSDFKTFRYKRNRCRY
ncbi:MAG: hypothetical protein K2H53_01510 [Clostridia bacterium]|nr:hypothetical protein [Clostridia bacterium]